MFARKIAVCFVVGELCGHQWSFFEDYIVLSDVLCCDEASALWKWQLLVIYVVVKLTFNSLSGSL